MQPIDADSNPAFTMLASPTIVTTSAPPIVRCVSIDTISDWSPKASILVRWRCEASHDILHYIGHIQSKAQPCRRELCGYERDDKGEYLRTYHPPPGRSFLRYDDSAIICYLVRFL